MVSSKVPTVYRAEGAERVYLTFEGLRESRTVVDKHTRVRVSMPLATVRELAQMLGAAAT
jgi:hypothetical protein